LRALVFVLVQQGLFGLYLGSSFAPNHKGMPILSADDDTDFLRRQVKTSRNVHGTWLVDLLLGGLNYQIEHHLFPSMPRVALRRARPIVRAYCRELDISYVETSLSNSYRQALAHLRTVARPGNRSTASASSQRPVSGAEGAEATTMVRRRARALEGAGE
jgi:fatty acid desaturase